MHIEEPPSTLLVLTLFARISLYSRPYGSSIADSKAAIEHFRPHRSSHKATLQIVRISGPIMSDYVSNEFQGDCMDLIDWDEWEASGWAGVEDDAVQAR